MELSELQPLRGLRDENARHIQVLKEVNGNNDELDAKARGDQQFSGHETVFGPGGLTLLGLECSTRRYTPLPATPRAVQLEREPPALAHPPAIWLPAGVACSNASSRATPTAYSANQSASTFSVTKPGRPGKLKPITNSPMLLEFAGPQGNARTRTNAGTGTCPPTQ